MIKKIMIKVFVNSATVALYRLWCKDNKRIPMDKFIKDAIELITKGYNYK